MDAGPGEDPLPGDRVSNICQLKADALTKSAN